MSKLIPGRTFPIDYADYRFELRVLSGEASDRLREITTSEVTPEVRDEAYGLAIAKWPWDGSLRSVLQDKECWELVAKAIEGSALSVDERKKFVSQLESEAG